MYNSIVSFHFLSRQLSPKLDTVQRTSSFAYTHGLLNVFVDDFIK